jgi:hypothetical protein
MCADCHSTGLKKDYDLAANSYATTWTDVDVSCEACQPLLCQVATSVLAPSDVAAPIRQHARKLKNLTCCLGSATGVDFEQRKVDALSSGTRKFDLTFDYLIIAAGMRPSYFGHDEFAAFAPSLKTLADAEAIRARILTVYELAELADDAQERARQLTFVLVGAGPSGVELAASIAQMATVTLRSDFRRIDPAKASILLNLVDQRQVFVALGILDLDTDRRDRAQLSVLEPPLHDIHDRLTDLVPGTAERHRGLLPRQLPRPVCQEQHVSLGQLVLANAPRHRFDPHPAGPAINPSHAIQQHHHAAP